MLPPIWPSKSIPSLFCVFIASANAIESWPTSRIVGPKTSFRYLNKPPKAPPKSSSTTRIEASFLVCEPKLVSSLISLVVKSALELNSKRLNAPFSRTSDSPEVRLIVTAPFCVVLSLTVIPMIEASSSIAWSRSLSRALGWSLVLLPLAITMLRFKSPILPIKVFARFTIDVNSRLSSSSFSSI